jgi:hypothetical protein
VARGVRLRIDQLQLLGVRENPFTDEGRAGHEIIFVCSGRLTDDAARTLTLTAVDPDGQRHEAVRIDVADLESGTVPVYPEGLLDLIRGQRV